MSKITALSKSSARLMQKSDDRVSKFDRMDLKRTESEGLRDFISSIKLHLPLEYT
jgi:hypothetical protein